MAEAEPKTSNSASNTTREKLLSEISSKLSILCSQIDSITEAVESLHSRSIGEENVYGEIRTEISRLKGVLHLRNNEAEELIRISKNWPEKNEMNLEKEATSKKKLITKIWNRNLNFRRRQFWNAYKLGQYAKLYRAWLKRDVPVIPRKYLFHYIPEEPPEETELRWNLMLKTFETDIELMERKKVRFEEKYKMTDMSMRDELSKLASGEILEKLNEMWSNDILKEEAKSISFWEKKAKLLSEYADSYGNGENATEVRIYT